MFTKPLLTQNRKVSSVGQSPAIFTESFTSTEQTITAAGLLTLAHGLSVEPKLFQAHLVCTSAELNYSTGDQVPVNFGPVGAGTGKGVQITDFDATNITLRYGNAATVMQLINKTTGLDATITITSWNLVVKAWA